MKKNNKKNHGFTLLELLLTLAISSIIITCLYSMLNFTTKACKFGDEKDEILLNGRYAIERIKREVKSAEKIIAIDMVPDLKEKHVDNIGFIIMRLNSEPGYKYNYSTYYLKNDIIYRIAANMNSDNLPDCFDFEGHNPVVEYVVSIEGTKLNFENNLIDLSFTLKGEHTKEIIFTTKICIRCPVIY